MSVRGTLVLAALLGLTACSRHESSQSERTELATAQVRVTKVEQRTRATARGLPGTVHPADQAVIASKLMATVEEADIVIGQDVMKGEVLLVLRADEIQAQVEQAEAMLAQLERNLEREQTLLAQKATTAEAVRTLQDQIRLANAQLSEARTMESYTRLRAPFDGTVTSKEVRRGDLATPGKALLTVEGMDSLQVYVQVPESLTPLKIGDPVTIQTNGMDLTGKLSEWSPAADPASRTRLAKLDLTEGAPVRSGQYVRVLWPAEVASSLWIPSEALSNIGQMERVFAYQDGQVKVRLIKTGTESGDEIEVLSGLHDGDIVVLSPDAHMMDGQPAELVQ